MSLPVRPPIFPRALLTPCPALLRAGPADEVTRERPSDAFDVALEAVSFDLVAVVEAASAAWEVVEACRGRPAIRSCRSVNRVAVADIWSGGLCCASREKSNRMACGFGSSIALSEVDGWGWLEFRNNQARLNLVIGQLDAKPYHLQLLLRGVAN